MRRQSLAFWGITGVFSTACIVSACQSNAPDHHAQVVAAVEDDSDYIDLTSLSWKKVDAPYAMYGHTATALPDWRVFVAGGLSFEGPYQKSIGTSYLFDPFTENWTSAGSMAHPRSGHAAFWASGYAFVVGGMREGVDLYEPLDEVEAYAPFYDTWEDFSPYLHLLKARARSTVAELPDGSVLVIGGHDDNGPVAAVDRFFPFSNAPSLPEPREGHTSIVLADGSVLVSGGQNANYIPTNTNYVLTDVYGAWEVGSSLGTGRTFHTATRLADGRVLFAGGRGPSGARLNSVEILTVSSGGAASALSYGIVAGPPMLLERENHTAALLPDGRVLVVGGQGMNGTLNTTEVFDPKTNSWTLGPSLNVARHLHQMVVVPGRVLVFGGSDANDQAIANVEVLEFGKQNGESCNDGFECLSGHCTDGVCCATACIGECVACTAAKKGGGIDGYCDVVADGINPRSLCSEGLVCKAGACGFPDTCPECEDVGAEWRFVPTPPMSWIDAAAGLDDGRIFILDSFGSDSGGYIFSPEDETWDPIPPPINGYYWTTSALKLLDGRVFVTGGASELFNPADLSWTQVSSNDGALPGHAAVVAPDGRVFAIGGNAEGFVGWVMVFNPSDNSLDWASEELFPARASHTVTVLQDGSLFAAGGFTGLSSYAFPLSTTNVLEPPYGDGWQDTLPLLEARAVHTATLLSDGRVLVVGGYGLDDEILSTAEIFDVSSNDVQPVASMHVPRAAHTAGLLPDGRVIVVGGENELGVTNTTEIYDPTTNEWKYGPMLNVPRAGHTMVVLPKRIVVIGGYDSESSRAAGVEILDLIKDVGDSCTADGECTSGHCVDGVCCDTACEGACVACTAALKGSGSDGVCGEVVDGTNPRSACEGGEVCQAGVCAAPDPCANQPDGTECGAGKVCENGACVDAPTECEGQADGTVCSIGDGCTMGICRQGSCLETHKLDGTRCEGGVCVAGQCKLDPTPTPPTGSGGEGGSSAGGPGDDGNDGENGGNRADKGASASPEGDDEGGGCNVARKSSSSPLAMSVVMLAALSLLRRRAAS